MKFHVVQQYYTSPDAYRDRENTIAFLRNATHASSTSDMKFHALLEPDTQTNWVPPNILNSPNISIYRSSRMKYAVAFDYIFKNASVGDFFMICNSDIILSIPEIEFDWCKSLNEFFSTHDKSCLFLSRHEISENRSVWKDPACFCGWSQDAWVFHYTPELKEMYDTIVENRPTLFDFNVGNCWGNDGRMVAIFKTMFLYSVYNLASTFKIYHLDRCRGHFFGRMITTDETDMSQKHPEDPDFPTAFLCPYSHIPNINCTEMNHHTHDDTGACVLIDFVEMNLQVISDETVLEVERAAIAMSYLVKMYKLREKTKTDDIFDVVNTISTLTTNTYVLHACKALMALKNNDIKLAQEATEIFKTHDDAKKFFSYTPLLFKTVCQIIATCLSSVLPS